MTVIAYKNGVLAADTSSWQGDVSTSSAEKIQRLRTGWIFAASGWKPEIRRVAMFLEGDAPQPEGIKDDELSGIVIKPDGSRWYVTSRGELFEPDDADIMAIGSHTEFLLGAMLAGASAAEAVAMAIRHCAHAKGDVRTMKFRKGVSNSCQK